MLSEKAMDPKKLVVVPGVDHYEVYAKPVFDTVMLEIVDWFTRHPPS